MVVVLAVVDRLHFFQTVVLVVDTLHWPQVMILEAKIHCSHMIKLDRLSLFGFDVVYIFLIVFVLIRCFVEYVRLQF